ncbi:MAG: 4Fe-4S dicluster domain-containing protein [Deltaproteobacteria bacterium]|nr:4Fe-4S dicluster domain-containing protein [Deltaproteobacteria bacterium]
MNKDQFLAKVRAAGVVGAGGAGFPTALKLASSPQYVLVNGAECEPLLKVDQQLAELRANELVRALSTVVAQLGAQGGVLAFKEKYQGALSALSREIKDQPNLSIKTLGNSYPMGDEQVLVYEVLGRVVPEGALPLAQGALVINVETLLNVFEAVYREAPVTHKYLTITGAVKKAATYRVPLGTSIAHVLEAAGQATVPDPVVITGGPMMGKLETDFSSPITKTTKGLIVLPKDHPVALAKSRDLAQMMRIAKTSCCHCAYCTELCPRFLLGHNLNPDKIMRLASYGQTGENFQRAGQVFLCCECGLCEQTCVMGLQPWRLNHELKGQLGPEVAKAFIKAPNSAVHRFRQLRGYPIPKLIQKLSLARFDPLKSKFESYPSQPNSVRLLLKQHLGAPSRPTVKPGDQVSLGTLIASPPPQATGAPIHASLSGHVSSVDSVSITIQAD